ncbi:MAG TPA: metal-dependent transcriptional regulator [Thermoplasmata archaeon]|nr:metal-dependent transcriptional regulator [Thermoplasmata archaeon]
MVTKRKEDYLEAIDEVVKKKGFAKVVDISRTLGIGFSSVSEMFQKLAEEGYLIYEKYKGVTLTERGKKVAKETQNRHDTLRSFLVILGVDEEVANEDACKIEHVVHRQTMEKLERFVSFVQQFEKFPIWLEYFKHYLKTGEFFLSSHPEIKKKCPIYQKLKKEEREI